MMPNQNVTADDAGPRSLVAELEQRRNRIARVHRSLGVVLGAYDLTLADLRAASGGDGEPATCSETTTA